MFDLIDGDCIEDPTENLSSYDSSKELRRVVKPKKSHAKSNGINENEVEESMELEQDGDMDMNGHFSKTQTKRKHDSKVANKHIFTFIKEILVYD